MAFTIQRCATVAVFALTIALANAAVAADWPQFMRNANHTGDAADETLRLPLGLVAQVRLDDAVLTAPAVVAGRAYVVDQMGTAYCIDSRAGRIVWKATPDGASAMGANTSSPCVANGRVYFGTTAGAFHILNASDGAVINTLKIGMPIVSAPTFANGRIYFQALDAVLRCLDADGKERWKWDHFAQYKEPPELTKSKERERGHPGSYDRPHYGGGDVAVSGKKVVTSFGWDVVCVEDAGTSAKLVWCNRAPTGRDGIAPMSCSISGDWVYTAGMGADGHSNLIRLSLGDGQVVKDTGRRPAYAWNTPAVRGAMTAYGNSDNGKNGIVLYDFDAKKSLASWRDDKESTPFASSHALTKEHVVATTLRGELIVLELNAKQGAKAYRFKTPYGKGIGSSPAIADGCIYFGCDDGYFYVLGPDGDRKPTADEKLTIHEPRGKLSPATGKAYDWPSTYGNAANTSAVDDPNLKAPLRLRWATRGFGHFLTPGVATGNDLVTVSLTGLLTCQEQMTGRIRWRTQMPGPEWGTSSGMLAAEGRLYLPRPTFNRQEGTFHCLDLATGRQIWSADIGGRYIWERAAPVAAAGKVAFGFASKGTPAGTMVQAWDAASGKPAWQVEMNVAGNRSGSIGGCTDGKVMYYTAGSGTWQWKQEGDKKRGEFVVIDPASGKVLFRTNEVFGTSYPVLANDRLLLNEDGLRCVSPADGKLLWKRPAAGYTRFSIGSDFIVMRGYGGHGSKVRLEDGKDYPNGKELGGATHACSSVALTPNLSFAITVGGLNVRDTKTGELLWLSPGFAPRGCVNPALANGRIFWPSAASGMIYCWESAADGNR
jgi:outer membrane protein assembly factor BamB